MLLGYGERERELATLHVRCAICAEARRLVLPRPLLESTHRLGSQGLPHPLLHLLDLARPSTAKRNQDPGGDVARKRTRKNNSRKSSGATLVVYTPRRPAERHLKHAVKVEEDRNRDKKSDWECSMRWRFVRSIERV